MKTLSKGANIDFPQGKIVNKTALLFLLFISTISSQTLLNNFGITDIVKTYKGYSKFRILDFNKDGIDDLFLFGNQEKNFVLHEGNKNSTFNAPIRKFFFFQIDDIKWFAKSDRGDDYYLFVSRKKRLVGLVSFTRNYAFQLLHTIEFNSYPSSILVTDIDDDGINEAFVYGNNFNGIIKVNNDGYRLISEVLYDQSVFGDLIIKDFNQDESKDIIAIDVLNNSLAFIENTEINGFTYGREITSDEELFSLSEFDYNQDSFSDLVVSKADGLEIILGDSVFSYSNSLKIPSDYKPTKHLFEDINNDEIIDFVSINNRDDQVIFHESYKDVNSNYNFHINGISDFSLLNKNNEKLLILLSKLGKIKIISNENKWKNDFSFSINGAARNLKILQNHDSVFSYLIFDNDEENTINNLKVDSLGNFIESEENQFQNRFTNFDNSDDLAYFVASSKGNRLLEIMNRDGLEIDQNYIYAKFPIEEVRFDSLRINILEMEGGNLYSETIVDIENNNSISEISFIDSSVSSSFLAVDNMIYYWKRSDSQLVLSSFKDSSYNKIMSISDTTFLKGTPLFVKNDNVVVSIVGNENNQIVYLYDGKNTIEYDFEGTINLSETNTDQIKFYQSISNDKTLLINSRSEDKILLYKFDEDKKSIVLSKSIDGIKINDYFVQNFFGINYLVYSDADNYCITFKVLD